MSAHPLITSPASPGTCTVPLPTVALGDRVYATTDGGDAWGWVCQIDGDALCLNCGHDHQLWVSRVVVREVVEG